MPEEKQNDAKTMSNRFTQLRQFQGSQKKWKKAMKKEITNTGITITGKSYLGIFPNFRNYTGKIVTKAKMRQISKTFASRRETTFFFKIRSLPQNTGDLTGLQKHLNVKKQQQCQVFSSFLVCLCNVMFMFI